MPKLRIVYSPIYDAVVQEWKANTRNYDEAEAGENDAGGQPADGEDRPTEQGRDPGGIEK